MNYTAKLNDSVNIVLIAGDEPIYLSPSSFTLYNDYTSIGVGQVGDVVTLDSLPPSLLGVEFNGTESLRVTPYKHVRSTSLSDDEANGHANSYDDDLAAPSEVRITGYVLHSGNHYVFNFDLYYYPAINKPNISLSRVGGILGSGSNTVSGNSTAAQINKYSKYKPDKAAPHGMGEFIKYAHKLDGNVKLVGIPTNQITIPWEFAGDGYYVPLKVVKMPIADSGLDIANVVLACGTEVDNISLSGVYTKSLVKYIKEATKNVALKIWNGSQYVTLQQCVIPIVQEAKPFTLNSINATPSISNVSVQFNITSTEAVQLYFKANVRICDDYGTVIRETGLIPTPPLTLNIAVGTANYSLIFNSGIIQDGENVHSVYVEVYSDNSALHLVDSDNWQNPSY